MRTWVILTVVATSAWGLDRQQVDGLLAQAAQSQGKKYLEARTELLRLDEKAVLLLREAAEDSKLSWQQRLVARIVVERITRGEELDAVRFHHWTSYPPYQQRWQPVVGPSGNMAPFVVPKLREAALWYYYIELTWKNTEEFGIAWGDKKYQKGDVRFSHECWPRWCRQALEGQPEEIYLWMAIADRIEKEEGFLESYDNRELFSALVRRHGCGMAIPILLQRWDEYVRKEFPDPRPDPHDRRMTHRNFLTRVISLAQPEHVALVERFIAEREEIFGELRPLLEEVRQRAPVKVEEPRFRCEKRPPLEGKREPPPGFFDPPRPPEPAPEDTPQDIVIEVN